MAESDLTVRTISGSETTLIQFKSQSTPMAGSPEKVRGIDEAAVNSTCTRRKDGGARSEAEDVNIEIISHSPPAEGSLCSVCLLPNLPAFHLDSVIRVDEGRHPC